MTIWLVCTFLLKWFLNKYRNAIYHVKASSLIYKTVLTACSISWVPSIFHQRCKCYQHKKLASFYIISPSSAALVWKKFRISPKYGENKLLLSVLCTNSLKHFVSAISLENEVNRERPSEVDDDQLKAIIKTSTRSRRKAQRCPI